MPTGRGGRRSLWRRNLLTASTSSTGGTDLRFPRQNRSRRRGPRRPSRGPAKDPPPLAVSGETARRADLSGRPGRRHAHALRPTQPTGPGRCGAHDAAPPHAQVDTDDDLLSARMPQCAPVEDRSPVTNPTSGGHLPATSHDDRRTTPLRECARPRRHGRCGQAPRVRTVASPTVPGRERCLPPLNNHTH